MRGIERTGCSEATRGKSDAVPRERDAPDRRRESTPLILSIPALLNRRSDLGDKPGDQIVKYPMIIKHAEGYRSQPIPQELLDAMGEFVAAGFKSGVPKDTAGLKATKEGVRGRSSGGKLTATMDHSPPFTTPRNSWNCP